MKLTVDGKTMQESFEVKADPRLRTTAAEYAKQLEFALKIRDKLSETHNAIIQIRDVRKQVDDLLKRIKDQPSSKNINDAGANLNKNLTAIEEALYQTKNQSSQDPLNFPIRLNNKLAALGGVVAGAETAPTDQSYAVYAALDGADRCRVAEAVADHEDRCAGVQSAGARSEHSGGSRETAAAAVMLRTSQYRER